jgi:hypothetical protein
MFSHHYFEEIYPKSNEFDKAKVFWRSPRWNHFAKNKNTHDENLSGLGWFSWGTEAEGKDRIGLRMDKTVTRTHF